MKLITYILILSPLLTSCSSHRQAASSSAASAAVEVQQDIRQGSEHSTELWSTLLAVADSLSLRMSADLVVVTNEGVAVVRPSMETHASRPVVSRQTWQCDESADSIVASTAVKASTEQTDSRVSESQTKAAAGGSLWLNISLIVAVLIFGAWLWWKVRE